MFAGSCIVRTAWRQTVFRDCIHIKQHTVQKPNQKNETAVVKPKLNRNRTGNFCQQHTSKKYSNIRILPWPNIRIHFFPTNPSPKQDIQVMTFVFWYLVPCSKWKRSWTAVRSWPNRRLVYLSCWHVWSVLQAPGGCLQMVYKWFGQALPNIPPVTDADAVMCKILSWR